MPLDLTDDKSTLVQLWLGAIRQQAITWANVDPSLCGQMASLGLNELMQIKVQLWMYAFWCGMTIMFVVSLIWIVFPVFEAL